MQSPPRPELVDVVIPTRDTRELTLRCVESVRTHGASAVPARCIVVDNGSKDGTAEALRAKEPDVIVVQPEKPLGFASACNLGASHGDGELILFLNSDVLADAGSIDRLTAFMRRDPECAAAGGRLVDVGTANTQVGFALRAFPTLAAQLALLVGLERYWPTNPVSRRQLMLCFDYGKTQYVNAQPAAACLMCRRSAFEQVGGFDERFYFWFEDVDLVRRLVAHGGRIAYVHDAVFAHLRSHTFSQWERPEIVRARYSGLVRYFVKHHSYREQLALRAAIVALALVRVPVLLVLNRQLARAYLDVAALAARTESR